MARRLLCFQKVLGITPNGTSEEYQKHKDWKVDTKLRGTPTVLINGYEMPDNYRIEDLSYFSGKL